MGILLSSVNNVNLSNSSPENLNSLQKTGTVTLMDQMTIQSAVGFDVDNREIEL